MDELTELIKKRKTMKNGAEDDDGVALSRRLNQLHNLCNIIHSNYIN